MILLYVLLSSSLACTALEEKAIRCDQHCISKQEPESWLKDNKHCVCGNSSEPDKPIFKVKSNKLKGQVIIDKKPDYSEDL
jgi:hypothetical protein